MTGLPSGSLAGKNILVTGGAGFVGVHVARELALHGARLVLQDAEIKRQGWLQPLLTSGQASFVQTALPGEALQSFEGGAQLDLILHLSLKMPPPAAALDAYLDANLSPLKHLLKLCPRGLQGICLASSAQVYGPSATIPIPEDSRRTAFAPYGIMKREMEDALLDFGQRQLVPITILRYSTIYGPGEWTSPRAIPSFTRKLLAGRPPVIYGDGLDLSDYLFVEDAAAGTRLALEHIQDAPGTYNIGSGRGFSTLHVAHLVRDLSGVDIEPVHAPARELRRNLVLDIRRAKDKLGFHTETSLEDGIAAEIEYERLQIREEPSEILA